MDTVIFEPAQTLIFEKQSIDENSVGSSSPTAAPQCTLKITNKEPKDAILFRIKTTSPLSYRVRPSHGRIPPGESLDVHVLMVSESKLHDKFLIKYGPIAVDQQGEFLELFSSLNDELREHRLKCQIIDENGFPVGEPAATESNSANPSTLPPVEPRRSGLGLFRDDKSATSIDSISANLATSDPEALRKDLVEARSTIQKLLGQNKELLHQIDEIKKRPGTLQPSPPAEWLAVLNSQTGFPPVLVILVALFSFLVGLLF